MDPAPFFVQWLELRLEAQRCLEEFARSSLCEVYNVGHGRNVVSDFSEQDLNPVERHRILRSHMRLQLIFRLSLIGKKAPRALIFTLTGWELEELKSVNEWLKHEYHILLQGPHGSNFRLQWMTVRLKSSFREAGLETLTSSSWLLESRHIPLFEPQFMDSKERNRFEYLISPFIHRGRKWLDTPRSSQLCETTKIWLDSPSYSGAGGPKLVAIYLQAEEIRVLAESSLLTMARGEYEVTKKYIVYSRGLFTL